MTTVFIWTVASASTAPTPVSPEQLPPQLPDKKCVGISNKARQRLHTQKKGMTAINLPTNLFQMHEVAIATTIAYIFFILPTCSFTKIRNWREVNNDGTP